MKEETAKFLIGFCTTFFGIIIVSVLVIGLIGLFPIIEDKVGRLFAVIIYVAFFLGIIFGIINLED